MITAALGLLPVAGSTAVAQTEDIGNGARPNIIFIMCDDMGYGDLGCYGQRRIETPNLDRMAQEGMPPRQPYAVLRPRLSPLRSALRPAEGC